MTKKKKLDSTFNEFSDKQVIAMGELKKSLLTVAKPDGIDRKSIEEALTEQYALQKVEKPKFFWCDSIWQFVAVRGLLYLLAVDDRDKVAAIFDQQFKDEKWKRIWQSLKSQLGDLDEFFASIQPNIDAFKAGEKAPTKYGLGHGDFTDSFFKQKLDFDLSSLKYESEKVIGDVVEEKFGIKAKLQLRKNLFTDYSEEFRTLVNSRFGLRSVESLLPQEFHLEFESQFDEETKNYFVDLTSKYIEEKDFLGLRAAFGGTPEEPSTKQIFLPGLSDHTALIRDITFSQGDWFPVVSYLVENFEFEIESKHIKDVLTRLTLAKSHVDMSAHELLCIVCDPPLKTLTNDRGLLHNEDGPALTYKDGYEVYALNGVVLPSYVIADSSEITVEKIDKEQNAEIRRIMVQRYGIEKYIEDSGAREIDSDEFGVLYKKEQSMDEPIVVVKVTNSTPEPDGSGPKQYFLRVPPYITTAKEAVAWTFDLDKTEYQPVIQS